MTTRLNVKSSFIRDVLYITPDKKLSVRIRDSWYDYLDVPNAVALGFEKAPSVGAYYSEHIKGKYQSTKR